MNKIGIVRLGAPKALESGLYQVDAIRCGKWDYPKAGENDGFEITPKHIKTLYDNFKSGLVGFEVPLNLDHENKTDCGWVKDVEVSSDGQTLYALVDVTDPETKKKVDDGTLKYSSSELDFEYVSPEHSDQREPTLVLEGLALTNHPYVKRMDPIRPLLSDRAALAAAGVHFPSVVDVESADTEETEEELTPPEEVMPEDKDTATKLSEFEAENQALKKRLADLETKAQAGETAAAETRRLRADLSVREVKEKLEKLVGKGKVPPSVARRALRLCEIFALSGNSKLQLSAPVTGRKFKLNDDEKDEVEEVDLMDEMVDMLGELPADVAVDGEQPDLSEEDGPAKSDDEDVELTKLADEEQEKAGTDDDGKPKLSRRDALKKARLRLSTKGGRN